MRGRPKSELLAGFTRPEVARLCSRAATRARTALTYRYPDEYHALYEKAKVELVAERRAKA